MTTMMMMTMTMPGRLDEVNYDPPGDEDSTHMPLAVYDENVK